MTGDNINTGAKRNKVVIKNANTTIEIELRRNEKYIVGSFREISNTVAVSGRQVFETGYFYL